MIARRLFLILCFLSTLILYAGCLAQEGPAVTDKPNTDDLYSWDFGQAKEGETLKHNFVLKNNSKETLNIKDVSTSCGCTVSEVKKKTLLPKEETLIEVRFNTKGYSGKVEQFIYVDTDSLDPSNSLSVDGKQSRTAENLILKFKIKADVVKKKN